MGLRRCDRVVSGLLRRNRAGIPQIRNEVVVRSGPEEAQVQTTTRPRTPPPNRLRTRGYRAAGDDAWPGRPTAPGSDGQEGGLRSRSLYPARSRICPRTVGTRLQALRAMSAGRRRGPGPGEPVGGARADHPPGAAMEAPRRTRCLHRVRQGGCQGGGVPPGASSVSGRCERRRCPTRRARSPPCGPSRRRAGARSRCPCRRARARRAPSPSPPPGAPRSGRPRAPPR